MENFIYQQINFLNNKKEVERSFEKYLFSLKEFIFKSLNAENHPNKDMIFINIFKTVGNEPYVLYQQIKNVLEFKNVIPLINIDT